MAEEVYDYVVIGGGSAGSVVAGRLGEAGADVLVLEAGPSDRRPDVYVPAGILTAYRFLNWRYLPEPDSSRGGAKEPWPAGRVLGGGGSINATVFVRGNPSDYDEWAEAGCVGWDYASVLPYFKRMETWAGPAGEFRGDRGPISVGFHSIRHPLNDAFLAAAQEAGHVFTPDYNGACQQGVGIVQVNQRRGVRSQSSREYLRRLPIAGRLSVHTRSIVQTILFDGTRATAVRYVRGGQMRTARAREEIVLSGGSIASPKLLMLSGVGPQAELARLGIDVVADIARVGANLQEHPATMQRWASKLPTINRLRIKDIGSALVSYVRDGTGLLASTVFHVQVMHRSSSDLPAPDVQIAFANFATTRERGPDGMMKVKPHRDEGVLVSTLYLRPKVRGSISLRSNRPEDSPVITHHLFAENDDVDRLLLGMEEGRRIMQQPAMAGLIGDPFDPERRCRSRSDWLAYLQENGTYGAHPIGTCRMGVDDDAVVAPDLTVRGVDGLRIVDASIMPTLTRGNTNAPSMMIGEKAADLILHRDPPRSDRTVNADASSAHRTSDNHPDLKRID